MMLCYNIANYGGIMMDMLQSDLKKIKKKKLIQTLKNMTDEEVSSSIDSNVVDFISSLDIHTIHSIFRNSNASMQKKMWENDTIQRSLILGTVDVDSFVCSDYTIRNLENLNKIIKSPTIKRQIYENKYFLNIVMFGNKIERRFFRSYDIHKVFEGMIASEEFHLLPVDKQLQIVERINGYTREILLPNDFRKKYRNIDRILFESDIENIDEDILLQLNEDELLFLEYMRNDINDHDVLKKYLMNSIKDQGKSLEDVFEDIQFKQEAMIGKIHNQFHHKYYFHKIDLKEKAYYILLHETDDEIIKEKLLKYLVQRMMVSGSFVSADALYHTLKRNLNYENLTYRDILNLTNDNDLLDKGKKLVFYQKFNLALPHVYRLQGISLEQLSKVNVKHINRLLKFMEENTQDEVSVQYSLCMKLYFIFGYERGLEILKGRYGECDKTFFDNVAKTDVSRVKMKEEGNQYLPVIDSRFIQFMFSKSNENHFIDMFQNKDSELYKSWYYFYNMYDEIFEKCQQEITLRKLNLILQIAKYGIVRSLITADNYLLNRSEFLENITLGNITHYSNNQVFEAIVEIYNKMKQRVESSIPYVEGTTNDGYQYQTMKLDDPVIFELGYRADCCIRTLDIAHNHLLHAALCRNGRILLLYDESGELAAFCPLKRNGNVLIANSIECIDKKLSISGHFISDAFKEAMEEIVEESKQSDEPIDLVCIGRKSYLKPEVVPFPKQYVTPTIFEKDDEIYQNTDVYHKELDIVYQDQNFQLENIQSRNPSVSYLDPREEIKCVDFCFGEEQVDEAIQVINSINYTKSKDDYRPISQYFAKKAFYSKDWYIADTHQGIIGEYLDTDYRAKEEFESCMKMMNEDNYQKILKRKD